MREDLRFVARGQLAVGADRRCVCHLLLVVADLEVVRAHDRLVKRHEYQPVPGRRVDLDRAERWQVGAGVDVDGFQLADLVTVGVNHVVAAPFPDVSSLEHASLPLQPAALFHALPGRPRTISTTLADLSYRHSRRASFGRRRAGRRTAGRCEVRGPPVRGECTVSSDAIVLLKADHKEIRRLFREFEAAGDRAVKKKAKIVGQIIELLTVHTYVENEVMYPEVRALLPELDEDVLESYVEHHVADVLCMELSAMSPDAERFDAKTTVLIENVTHHIEEEEQEWFPKVRAGLGRKKLQELGAKLEQTRKRRLGRPRSPVR